MRQRLFRIGFTTIILALGTTLGAHEAPSSRPAPISPESALKNLIDGNARYRGNISQDLHRNQARRDEVISGQNPYAIILSCSDSRAPVEIIFDAGIGDLFVIRVAGNVAEISEIGTIEYGVEHLHTPLVVVLGHTSCGAVTAVVEHAHVTENIAKLVAPIVPAVERAHREHPDLAGAALVPAATRENVWHGMAELLTRSEILRNKIAHGDVLLIGGIYNLHTGEIDWMGKHPDEAKLITAAPAPTTAPHADGEDEHGDAAGLRNYAPKVRRENFAALGALLGAAAFVSALLIRLTGSGRGK